MLDKLSEYGSVFQTKIISLLLSDTMFLKQSADLLERDFFNTESRQKIYSIIFDYYFKYKVKPEPSVLIAELEKLKDNEILYGTVKKELQDSIKLINSTDLPYVRDETIEFCKNHQIRLAINDSISLLQQNDFDAIKLRIEAALKVGNVRDIGIDYKEDVDRVFLEDARSPIPLPWNIIAKHCDGGGIGAGELGVIAGTPGIGKSWHLVNIAAHFLKLGKNVIFYTLELGESVVVKRFYSLLTGIPTINLKSSISDIKDLINNQIEGNLIVKYYPTGTASMLTVQSHYEEIKISKFIPDAVIVDYADLLKPTLNPLVNIKNQRQDQVLAALYVHMRGFAGEQQIPVWTASQINRNGVKDEVVEGDNIEGAFSKLFVADFVFSAQRTRKQKQSQRVTGHIIKSRIGPDGLVFLGQTNLEIGLVEYNSLSDEDNFDNDSNSEIKNNSHSLLTETVKNRKRNKF